MSHNTNIGKLITTKKSGLAIKDAIHVAICPVMAARGLKPGQHIGIISITNNGEVIVADLGPTGNIGVVDPFLIEPILPKDKFYLFLYPNTITNLRHNWSHPAFSPDEDGSIEDLLIKKNRKQAIEWLTNFADKLDMTYSELLRATERFIMYGDYHCLNYSPPDFIWEKRKQFWNKYMMVTSNPFDVPPDCNMFFTCAC